MNNRNTCPWIIFTLNGTEFSVNSKYVTSIEILGKSESVQGIKPGTVYINGEVIQLINLRAMLSLWDRLAERSTGLEYRHIILVIEADHIKRGLIADQIIAIEDVASIKPDDSKGYTEPLCFSQTAMRTNTGRPLLIVNPEFLCAS